MIINIFLALHEHPDFGRYDLYQMFNLFSSSNSLQMDSIWNFISFFVNHPFSAIASRALDSNSALDKARLRRLPSSEKTCMYLSFAIECKIIKIAESLRIFVVSKLKAI